MIRERMLELKRCVRRTAGVRLCVLYAIFCCISACLNTGCLYSHRRVCGLVPQARVIEARNYRVLGESEARSSSFNLLWIIPVTPRVDYDRAVNDAVAAMSGDNLIDVRTWMERQFWVVGMVDILHVKGKVIKYEK